jgi:hypothetical protein
MLSVGLWRWCINTTITILDIIHRPVFYLRHYVSETGFFLSLQEEPTHLGPLDTAVSGDGDRIQSPKSCPIKRQDDRYVQNCDSYVIFQVCQENVERIPLSMSRSPPSETLCTQDSLSFFHLLRLYITKWKNCGSWVAWSPIESLLWLTKNNRKGNPSVRNNLKTKISAACLSRIWKLSYTAPMFSKFSYPYYIMGDTL